MLFDLDNNMGIARTMSYYQTVFEDWSYIVKYLEEMRSISVSEITDVLGAYFTGEKRTVGILVKKGKK